MSSQSRHQQTQTQRKREKFFAWLGEILSTGMTQEDFNKAEKLFTQGVSVAQMRATLEKPHKR